LESYLIEAVLLTFAGILDQSAVWVDEMNYYDMRTDRNKGIPPLSFRPANPLGIEIEK
jgi:exocyst complex component 2